ncbi:MAG: hypothetical protein AAFU85_27060 [Planctomycetota bacterium]
MIAFASKRSPRKPRERKRWTLRVGEAVDTALCDLFPSLGAKRVAARQRRKMVGQQIAMLDRLGYSWPGAAPSHSRDGRCMGTKASPDDAIEHDLPELRQRCVELYRGKTVAHAAVEGGVTSVGGVRRCRCSVN